MRSGAAQEIYDLAGDWVAITAPARFLWIAKHEPDRFAAIAHVGMLGDWILTRLCGEFATDPSLGSSSGMFDLAARTWSERVIELVGLEPSLFPAGARARHGRRRGDDCGGRSHRPRGGDARASSAAPTRSSASLGIGVVEPGRFTVVGGSFWQHTVVLDEPAIDPQARLRTLCHAVPGRWMMEGIGFYSGLTMRWFRDAFCEREIRELAAQRGVDVYDLLEGEAARAYRPERTACSASSPT